MYDASVTGRPPRYDESELRAALASEEEDLLIQLGSFGADVGPSDPLERGLRVYGAAMAKLRGHLCEAPNVRELGEAKPDLFTLTAAIAEIVAEHEPHLPVAILSALAVKLGLRRLCSDYWC